MLWTGEFVTAVLLRQIQLLVVIADNDHTKLLFIGWILAKTRESLSVLVKDFVHTFICESRFTLTSINRYRTFNDCIEPF